MFTQKIMATCSVLFFATLFFTGAALAHSSHDHSHLPIGWVFDSKVTGKIEKNLERGNLAVGLSKFEQAALANYGIRVGHSFTTRVGADTMKVTRTTTGLRLEGLKVTHPDGSTEALPIRRSAQVILSANTGGHAGHDHRHLPLAWVFNAEIESKIHNNTFNNDASGAIGLNRHEQKVMERYGIQVGNSFQAHVADMTFIVKRTTMGLKILNHVDGLSVAYVPGNSHAVY